MAMFASLSYLTSSSKSIIVFNANNAFDVNHAYVLYVDNYIDLYYVYFVVIDINLVYVYYFVCNVVFMLVLGYDVAYVYRFV